MGFYERNVLPRITEKACGRRDLDEPRARVVGDLTGEVIEIGFGSGHNLAHYPARVGTVLAVEPSTLARRLAAPRVSAATARVEFIGVDGQQLPVPDRSVDAAVSTFTLCTIPDVGRALGELRRVLRAGGGLHFLEHGVSPDPRVARWQHRLTPLQRRVAGGCHFDRPIDRLLIDNGFEIAELDNYYLKGPKFPSYMYEGIAYPA